MASPVATVEQVVEDDVGAYTLADEGISYGGVEGALQSAQLRYTAPGNDRSTDVLHGVEVHLDAEAARRRVRTFGSALNTSGYRIVRRQELESATGDVQGMFYELRRDRQRLLVWSNRNVFFSLGGGTRADIDTFYDDLPY